MRLNPNEGDNAIAVLKQIYEQSQHTIPWTLVDACYQIERKHQYESDRELALNDLRHAVARVVSALLDTERDGVR